MTGQILFTGITPEDFMNRLATIIDERVEERIKQQSATSHPDKVQYLQRKDVCEILRISLPTLNDYTKEGYLSGYKIGNRVLYKQNEVEEALHKIGSRKGKKGGVYAS